MEFLSLIEKVLTLPIGLRKYWIPTPWAMTILVQNSMRTECVKYVFR